MKRTLLITILLLVVFTALASADSNGNTIRIYAEGGDFSEIVAFANIKIEPQGLSIVIVDVPEDADIKVALVNSLPGRTTGAISHAYNGEIEMKPEVFPAIGGDTLLHEMGHCAGLGHESDPRSVMYESTGFGSQQLKTRHVEALRRLSGITPLGRWIAQVKVLID